MKKIFLLTFLFGLTFSLFAQRGADRILPFTWSQDNQHQLYTGGVLDYVSSAQDSLAIDFTLSKTYPVQYDGAVLLDSTSLPRVVVKLQGKVLDIDSWSDITTVIYIGSADTTIKFSFHTEPTTTFTLLFDTTKVAGTPSGVGTLLFDTTKIAGTPSGVGSFTFDTTKLTTRTDRELYTGSTVAKGRQFYSAATVSKGRQLYSATGTMIQTSVSKYYYKMRILMIRTRGTANLNKMEWKFWQRLY